MVLPSRFAPVAPELPAHSDDSDEEDPYFLLCGQADKAVADENYEEAAARLLDAMMVKPDSPFNPLLLSNLGMIYSCLGRDSLALETLDEAHRREPALRRAIENRALVLLKMGSDKDAFRDFSDVIEADSVNLEARYYRGLIALYGGNPEIAETDFNMLRRLAPASVETARALSSLYSLTGRDAEAIPYFRSLVEREPSPEYYAGLAGCYLAVGKLSEAGTSLAEGLAAYPEDPELYYYRAWLNRDRYLLDDARADARMAIRLGANPKRVNALFK